MITKKPELRPGLPLTINFEIPAYWTPEQALAVFKLLDGLRAGIPVVTTSDGALGLPLEDGKEALISSDPEGFAQRVERLVKDDALQERLPEAATRTLSHTTLFRSRNA